jgi:hypothetical protein
MLHWCGIGRRSTPLDYWKVLLVRARGDVVGVSGLYRQPGMPHNVCWIGCAPTEGSGGVRGSEDRWHLQLAQRWILANTSRLEFWTLEGWK